VKGLLLKDWYMMKKYCRSFLLIAAVFLAISFAGDENMFFVFYPCLLCGVLPVNLLGYDERSRWMQYSGTLPYTRAQIVSAKYLVALLAQVAVLLATGLVQGIKMVMNGSFSLEGFLTLMLLMITVATVASSISMPFMFKLGVEKGRSAYYVMVGVVCGASVIAPRIFKGQLRFNARPNVLLAVLAAAGVGVYALSWYLSVVFYRKREI